MEGTDRWAAVDEHLPPELRTSLEERFWRPIEAQATLDVLRDDPSFYADPGRHPAIFADHGVVHVRDVAAGLVHLVDALDGLLLSARPLERRRFMAAYGVAVAYLHDVGMVDMSRVGRRVHPEYGAHAAWWQDSAPLVEHLLAVGGPVRARLDTVHARAPFAVPLDIVVRELLSLTAAHSKTTIPIAVLNDRAALAVAMRRILFTSLDDHRAAAGGPAAGDRSVVPDDPASRHPDPDAAFAWLAADDGPQAELADDVVDAIRILRAADVLRQRGTALRTSAGYEVCFDARTALAVCTLRAAGGDAAYVITYSDPRGAGEANIRVAYVTPQGHLRVAFHRGGFPSGDVAQRAAESVAHAIVDIVADVVPSLDGPPARGLPTPARAIADVRIQLEQPEDDPAFAEAVAATLGTSEPSIAGRLEVVANLEGASPEERRRFFGASPVEDDSPFADEIRERLVAHGSTAPDRERTSAFREVGVATVKAGETLVAAGTPPSFVYVPMGPGLVVRPGGGYTPSPLQPWVPVGTTGVIRRSERNSQIAAWRDVDVLMIPGERYATDWLRALTPDELRARLIGSATAE